MSDYDVHAAYAGCRIPVGAAGPGEFNAAPHQRLVSCRLRLAGC
jgi:hypothetical protein